MHLSAKLIELALIHQQGVTNPKALKPWKPADEWHQPNWYEARQKEPRVGELFQLPEFALQDKRCAFCEPTPLETQESLVPFLRTTVIIKEEEDERPTLKDLQEEHEDSSDAAIEITDVLQRVLNWVPGECLESKTKHKDFFYLIEFSDGEQKGLRKWDHHKNLKMYEIGRLYRKSM